MDSLREAKTKLAAVNKDTIAFISSFTDDKSFVETDAFVGGNRHGVRARRGRSKRFRCGGRQRRVCFRAQLRGDEGLYRRARR